MLLSSLAIILSLLFPFFYWVSTKGSPLEFAPQRGKIAPAFLLLEIFILIIPAVILLVIFGPDEFSGYDSTKREMVPLISFLSIASVWIFLASFVVTFRMICRRGVNELNVKMWTVSRTRGHRDWIREMFFFSSILIAALIFTAYFFYCGGRHALIYSELTETLLKDARMGNKYTSNVPSVIMTFIRISAYMIALGAGRCRGHLFALIFLLLVSICLATLEGGKGPVVFVFISFFAGFYSLGPRLSVFRACLVVLCMIVTLVSAGYLMVRVQFGDIPWESVWTYFANRVLVGQMAGTYEAISIGKSNVSYFLHAIPFAGQFVNYTPFQRDLMIISENVGNIESTGVKNSLFISEAFGIGGGTLVLLSSIIVGVSSAISYIVLGGFFSRFFRLPQGSLGPVLATFYFSQFRLTGGFAEWPMFKWLLLNLVYLACISISFYSLLGITRVLRPIVVDRYREIGTCGGGR